MHIENHKLIGPPVLGPISYNNTPNISGVFADNLPDTIIVHYTGGNSLGSSVAWLTDAKSKVSAHLVIGKNGEIVQLAPFNVVTWHAGISEWKGRSQLNKYSIGIELDNAGHLTKRPDGYYTHFGKKIGPKHVVLAQHKHQDSEKAWEAFTEAQIETTMEVCSLLKGQYNISEVLGHNDIAIGRKEDPGPAFPMKYLQDKVLGAKNNDVPGQENEVGTNYNAVVMANYLNIRAKPGLNAQIVANPLSRGTKLTILDENEEWCHVKYTLEGWVSKKWLKLFNA